MALDLAGYEARARAAGDAMGGFVDLLAAVVRVNGPAGAALERGTAVPGYFPYRQRYQLLCQRLVRERLYTAACALASPRTAAADGQYAALGELTGLRAFVCEPASADKAILEIVR